MSISQNASLNATALSVGEEGTDTGHNVAPKHIDMREHKAAQGCSSVVECFPNMHTVPGPISRTVWWYRLVIPALEGWGQEGHP